MDAEHAPVEPPPTIALITTSTPACSSPVVSSARRTHSSRGLHVMLATVRSQSPSA